MTGIAKHRLRETGTEGRTPTHGVSLRLSRRGLMVPGLLWLAGCDRLPGALTTPAPGLAADAPVPVALLVPSGSGNGEREALAESLANAATLAAETLQNARVALIPLPTGGSPEGAAEATQTALAQGARLIVGPLFSTAAAAAGPIAAAQGVPLFSFSNTAAVAGGNVYLLGFVQRTVAERVVGYLAATGVQRLATVMPAGLEGDLAAEAVAAAAAARGVEVVARGSYALSVEGISAAAPGIAEDIRGTGAEAAVFSDGPTGGLVLIAETLRGMGVRAEDVRFAGLSRWSASSAALAQPGLSGGVFAAPDPALTEAFETRYALRFGTPAHPLAGLAFDGVAAAGALIAEARQEGANDPFSAARITDPKGFAGVLGAFRLRADGTSDRALAIFEVRDGVAVLADPAPTGFGDARA